MSAAGVTSCYRSYGRCEKIDDSASETRSVFRPNLSEYCSLEDSLVTYDISQKVRTIRKVTLTKTNVPPHLFGTAA